MVGEDFTVPVVLLSVAAFVYAIYFFAGRLGNVKSGKGPTFEPFAGGEDLPPIRSKYHSELFVYAAVFLAFEVFSLLIATSFESLDALVPIAWVAAGGFSLFVIMLWFIGMGGADIE